MVGKLMSVGDLKNRFNAVLKNAEAQKERSFNKNVKPALENAVLELLKGNVDTIVDIPNLEKFLETLKEISKKYKAGAVKTYLNVWEAEIELYLEDSDPKNAILIHTSGQIGDILQKIENVKDDDEELYKKEGKQNPSTANRSIVMDLQVILIDLYYYKKDEGHKKAIELLMLTLEKSKEQNRGQDADKYYKTAIDLCKKYKFN